MWVILGEDGKPLLGGDHERRFFEASWMFRRNGVYYFTYSTGDTHFLAYATGKSPVGPFQYRGHFLLPVQGWTTHHSIMEVGEGSGGYFMRTRSFPIRITCAM